MDLEISQPTVPLISFFLNYHDKYLNMIIRFKWVKCKSGFNFDQYDAIHNMYFEDRILKNQKNLGIFSIDTDFIPFAGIWSLRKFSYKTAYFLMYQTGYHFQLFLQYVLKLY